METTYRRRQPASGLERLLASLMRQELGQLVGDLPAHRTLCATLLAWFETGGKVAAAARALHVHRNTVLYRVHRAQTVLGRPVDLGDLRLRLALMLHAAIGNEGCPAVAARQRRGDPPPPRPRAESDPDAEPHPPR